MNATGRSWRVIRCEMPHAPKDPIRPNHLGLDWDSLPVPRQEAEFDPEALSRLSSRPWNCAAYEHTIEIWFPRATREVLRAKGFVFRVLEVDPDAVVFAGRMQACIDRDRARVVGEYLQ